MPLLPEANVLVAIGRSHDGKKFHSTCNGSSTFVPVQEFAYEGLFLISTSWCECMRSSQRPLRSSACCACKQSTAKALVTNAVQEGLIVIFNVAQLFSSIQSSSIAYCLCVCHPLPR